MSALRRFSSSSCAQTQTKPGGFRGLFGEGRACKARENRAGRSVVGAPGGVECGMHFAGQLALFLGGLGGQLRHHVFELRSLQSLLCLLCLPPPRRLPLPLLPVPLFLPQLLHFGRLQPLLPGANHFLERRTVACVKGRRQRKESVVRRQKWARQPIAAGQEQSRVKRTCSLSIHCSKSWRYFWRASSRVAIRISKSLQWAVMVSSNVFRYRWI